MKRDLFVFDCDGVLRTISWYEIFRAYHVLSVQCGGNFAEHCMTVDDFKVWFDHDWKNNLRRIGIDTPEAIRSASTIFHEVYDPHMRTFSWVEEIFAQLSQRGNVAVLSNSSTVSVRRSLVGCMRYVQTIVGSDTMKRLKPDPSGLQTIIGMCDAVPEQTFMIGDAHIDIMTGKNAGTHTLAVSWGITESLEELIAMRSDVIAMDAYDLLHLL